MDKIREEFAVFISGSAYGLTTAHEKALMFETFLHVSKSKDDEIAQLKTEIAKMKDWSKSLETSTKTLN